MIRFFNSPAVEVDETLVTHLVNGRGVYESQCWVLGAIDRSTKEFVLEVVGNNRSQEKFKEFFAKHINTAIGNPTRVYTDGHRSYEFLSDAGYFHRRITHERGFGVGVNTTNRIESFWSTLKRFGNFNKGVTFSSISDVESAVSEASWRILCNQQDINPAVDLARIIK